MKLIIQLQLKARSRSFVSMVLCLGTKIALTLLFRVQTVVFWVVVLQVVYQLFRGAYCIDLQDRSKWAGMWNTNIRKGGSISAMRARRFSNQMPGMGERR